MDDRKNKQKKDEAEKIEEVAVKEEKDDKDKKIEQLTEQLARAVADYKNLERRSFEEKSEAVRFANKQLVEALLPAFDTLFLAGRYTNDDSVKLTVTRVLEILRENGIEKVATDDAQYNAQTMEAVEVVDGPREKIIEEMRPGFILHGKLIRPAQVKVGKGEH